MRSPASGFGWLSAKAGCGEKNPRHRLIVTAHRAGSAPIYLIANTTSRDFSLLVLLLAIAGKLDLFLWIAGIRVHLFWIIALRSQWRDTGRAPAISEKSA
jgi:type IV secretory pathway TrbD component